MAHCDDSLKLIGKKIKEYQKENDGKFPPNLETLIEQKKITVWELVCPVSPFAVGDSSYIYRGDDLYVGVPDELIVAYDKIDSHKGRRNVLFANGKVHRQPESIFDKFIDRDNEYRKMYGLAEKKKEIVRLEEVKHLRAQKDLEELSELEE